METATINIDEELMECISELNAVQKKSILELVKSFVDKDEKMKPQTIEEYNNELEEAVAKVKAGEFYTHEEVKELAKSW